MESVVATVSGYHDPERSKLIKLISRTGANFVGRMDRSTTHLVCWRFEGRKYDLAKKFNMFIVNHQWVEECIKQGRCVPEQPYLLQRIFVFCSGQEVGPLRLEVPLVIEKVTLLTTQKSDAQNDYTGNAIGSEHGMDGQLDGTRSRLLSEGLFPEFDISNTNSRRLSKKTSKKGFKHGCSSSRCYKEPLPPIIFGVESEEPSCPSSMLFSRHEWRSTTSAEPPRKGRRLVKKSIIAFVSASEQESNTFKVGEQYNNLATPSSHLDAMRDEKRLRIRRVSDDGMYSSGPYRNEGLENVEEVEDLNADLTIGDSNLHCENAPTTAERTLQNPNSSANKNSKGTNDIARLPTSIDLSCVICWTDFSSTRGVLPCGHRFCFSCIQSWADLMASRRKISTCPLCKASFVSITKVDDAVSSDQKIYSQSIPCDPSRMDIFILPDGETPTSGPQSFPVCIECCCQEPEDLLVRCHLCQVRCIHSYCLDPPLLPWTCIHCKDFRLLYHRIR
ncbi:BRCT domain-containing protein [Actinidia chinensis var. chinensis]|uniref:RING-type E3 ubiquitin transferase BRCA1 n=1 Tax=Actinidia chinensis var. chinensis TaxID=1590841 RepID=A0A2R6RKK2_ACTCC|nr:BRCT domain-containing protein [Actinidia chinensis var. chinensis]